MEERNVPLRERLRIQYQERFRSRWNSEPMQKELLEVGRGNTHGTLYLYGGYVYRTILSSLDNDAPIRWEGGKVDIDFVADRLTERESKYRGWQTGRRTFFGNPRFLKGEYQIDFDSFVNYKGQGEVETPRIENVLAGAPFDIQAISWDCDNEELVTDPRSISIRAMHDRKLQINNVKRVHAVAESLNISDEDFLRLKAKELGLTPVEESVIVRRAPWGSGDVYEFRRIDLVRPY